MKLLPIYSNSVLKSDVLIGGNVVAIFETTSNCTCSNSLCNIGSEMSSDDRSWLMQSVLGMDISSTVSYFYPRLIPVVGIYCIQLINCLGVRYP